MRRTSFLAGGAAAFAILALMAESPLEAAENDGVRPVAEELGQRAAPPPPQSQGGLSDGSVRVLMTYAFSIIPDDLPGADGKPVKVDKSDPNKFLIPAEDARRVIRAATRTAYAEACNLFDLAKANFDAMMQTEEAKKVWSQDQLMMIKALHVFSASYFTGNAKITDDADAAKTSGEPKQPAGEQLAVPKKPPCPPEQKQKVVNSITAYVQAAKSSGPAGAAPKQ